MDDLRRDLGTRPPSVRPAPAPAPRVLSPLRRALLVGALVVAVVLAGHVVAAAVAGLTGTWSWLAGPAVALPVALVGVLPPRNPGGSVDHARTAAARARPVVAVVLLVGVGGLALTLGVRAATGWATGHEPGVARLAVPAVVEGQGVRVAVDDVTHTAHFTRVHVQVTSTRSVPVVLPATGARLTAADGTTLQGDASRSDVVTVPPGTPVRGTLVFPGHLPGGATTGTLSLAVVERADTVGTSPLVLDGLALQPVEDAPGDRRAGAQARGAYGSP